MNILVAQTTEVRNSQLKTMAILMLSFLRPVIVSTTSIRRTIEDSAKPKHRIKRVDHFLADPPLDLRVFARALIRMATAQLKHERLLLALACTELHDDGHHTVVLA